MLVDAEQSGSDEEAENANDFVNAMAIVTQKRKDRQIIEKRVTGYQQLYPVPDDSSAQFQVWSFAPSGDQIAEYENALASCFTEDGRYRDQLPHASHNSVSVGLLVRFGETRVVLCGDVERDCWGDVRALMDRGHFLAHAVKVGHHGSETGYVDGLWQDLADRKKPIAVIAPYRRFHLPKPAALAHIRPHVSKILVTCEMDATNTPGAARKPLKSRLFLREKLRARPVPSDTACGRCTLVFDASGNCIREECILPAHGLEADD